MMSLASGDQIRISIVTPSLNRAKYIAKAIDSVARQDYQYTEHIIMDGGSSDGTLDILSRYPQLKVICQPDNGLYDALNNGIQLGIGEIVGLLNTDDYYGPEILESVAQTFRENPNIEAISGEAIIFRDLPSGKREIVARFAHIQPSNLLAQVTRGTPMINAWFFRKHVFEQLGGFDTQYSISADRDFMIRFALQGFRYATLDQTVYFYRQHAESITITGKNQKTSPDLVEDCAIAEGYLIKENEDAPMRTEFKAWHSQVISDLVISALRKPDLGKACSYASRGLRYNRAWPILFMYRTLWRARRYVCCRVQKFFCRILQAE